MKEFSTRFSPFDGINELSVTQPSFYHHAIFFTISLPLSYTLSLFLFFSLSFINVIWLISIRRIHVWAGQAIFGYFGSCFYSKPELITLIEMYMALNVCVSVCVCASPLLTDERFQAFGKQQYGAWFWMKMKFLENSWQANGNLKLAIEQ